MGTPLRISLLALVSTLAISACDSPEEAEPEEFQLRFGAVASGAPVDCSTRIGALGPDGTASVGVSDLRFYVSNVRFFDKSGSELELELAENDFQYAGEGGQVSLIDLTGNAEGSCAGTAIAFAEGTARTNHSIKGSAVVGDIHRVSFDVGVPQALMQRTIATTSEEAAPSPLSEMYWSWATGYRHFVMNVSVDNGAGEVGDGYLHVGSRDCAGEGVLALEDRDACTFVNTASVVLDDFDVGEDAVLLNLDSILAGFDYVAPIYDPETFEVIGEGVGAECHSSPMQPDCDHLFSVLGIDMESGSAAADSNSAFTKGPASMLGEIEDHHDDGPDGGGHDHDHDHE